MIRHSRVGGNPGLNLSEIFRDSRNFKFLDSRLRGNDGLKFFFLQKHDAMQPAVYILASQRNGTLYIGVTSNLIQRVYQHREHLAQGFTNQHHVTMLVWYELHSTMEHAITREKQLKKWNRQWKLRLIEEKNPGWQDLWFEIIK